MSLNPGSSNYTLTGKTFRYPRAGIVKSNLLDDDTADELRGRGSDRPLRAKAPEWLGQKAPEFSRTGARAQADEIERQIRENEAA
jgi:hypothetical protein